MRTSEDWCLLLDMGAAVHLEEGGLGLVDFGEGLLVGLCYRLVGLGC